MSVKRLIPLIFCIFLSVGYLESEEYCSDEFTKNIIGKPYIISVYEAKASDSFGEIKINDKKMIAKYKFNSNNLISEKVGYENGSPIEYMKCFFDSKNMLVQQLIKTRNEQRISYFIRDDKGLVTEIDVKNSDGKLLSRMTIERKSLENRSVELYRQLDDHDQITFAQKIQKDIPSGRILDVFRYDQNGSIKSVERYSYSYDGFSVTKYDENSQLLHIYYEKHNNKNEISEYSMEWQGLLSDIGKSKYFFEYKYDYQGNWIQKLKLTNTEKFGGDFLEPEKVFYREIEYASLSSEYSSSIEPEIIFPKQDLAKNENNINQSKIFAYEGQDPFDDAHTLTVMIPAESGQGVYGDNIFLVLRIKENSQTSVYINWQSYLGSDEPYVTIRIGKEEPVTENWSISTDKKASFYLGQSTEMIQRLINSSQVVAKVTPYNESPIIATFNLTGLLSVLQPFLSVLHRTGIEIPRKVIVASDCTWPPMEFVDESKEFVGFDIDLIKAIAKAANFNLEIKNTAWDGIFAGLLNNSYDAVISSVKITKERMGIMDFSEPYVNAGQVLVVQDSTQNVTKIDDLQGKVVGAQIGVTGTVEVEETKNVRFKTYDDIGLAIEDLYSGQLAGVIVDLPIAADYIFQNTVYKGKLKIVGEPLTQEFYGIAVKKGDAKLLEMINSGLRKVKDSGELDAIEKKWLRK